MPVATPTTERSRLCGPPKEETMKTTVTVALMVLALAALGCGNKIRTGLDYHHVSQVQDSQVQDK